MQHILFFLKFLSEALFFLPGTILHELSHLFSAILFAHPSNFSICPRIGENGSLIFGRVQYSYRFRASALLVSIAPLIWWFLTYRLIAYDAVFFCGPGTPFYLGVPMRLLATRPLNGLVYCWILFQLLWAGKLSIVDIKGALMGLCSITGLMVVIATTVSFPFAQPFLVKGIDYVVAWLGYLTHNL